MNGHSIINTVEATEHLKNILNLNVEKTESCAVNTNSKFSCTMEKTNNSNFGNENMFQKIELTGEDANVPIYGTDVSVISSPLHHSPSIKIMIENLVDFGWEYKNYIGRIMTVHLSTKYLAYSLKSPVSPSGFVRVMKQDSSDNLLIRGFKGTVKDIAFAYSTNKVILACIDEFAQLFIYEILDNGTNLINQLLLHVMKKDQPSPTAYHRLFWCPYVPDENLSDDDMSMLLCVIQDEKAEILRVDTIMKLHTETTLYSDDLKNGYLVIANHSQVHTQPITAAAFSPDGIALATASLDGEVKFFQISVQEGQNAPKYLHQWNPHCGKPLSSLVFLDNIKNTSPDVQFWKYAITGAENNQEIKLWSCQNWLCLQTISFQPHPGDTVMPLLKSELDLTGKYLFLSDITRKVLYILKIRHKEENGQSFISSVSEYPVLNPVFSLFCTSVCKPKTSEMIMKIANDNDEEYGLDEKDDDDEDDSEEASENAEQKLQQEYTIKLYWVNSKSLQSCRVLYQLKSESPVLSIISSIGSSQESFEPATMNILEPGNTTLDLANALNTSPTSVLTSEVPYYKGCDDILLTPKDFTSPSHTSLPSVNISNTFKLPSVEEVSSNLDNKKQDISSDINNICARRKSSQHSSSSSPSREVAEILSPRQLINHEVLSPSEEKDADMIIIDPPLTSNEWPQAPDPNKEYKVSTEGDILIPHESRHSLHDAEIATNLNDSTYRLQRMEQEIKSIHHKIAMMSEDVHGHGQNMQYVQTNLHEVGQQQKYIQNNLQNFITVATNLLTKFEQLSENSSTGYAGMENLLDKWDSNEKLRVERQTSVLSQKILSDMNLQVEKAVKQEISATLVPHITSYMDTAVTQMQENLLQKLNATDSAIKECIGRHIKSKAFTDNLAHSLNNVLQKSIQNICKETFQNSVVPSFEKSCQYLIRQINDIFSAGTADYMQHMDQQVKSVVNNFESSTGALQEQITNISSETNSILAKQSSKLIENNTEYKRQNEQLMLRIRQTIQEEVRKAFKEQATNIVALRSHTASPVQTSESTVSWDEIQHLIKAGQINEAFQQTLSAMNLNLVLRLCESVTVDQVFGGDTCPLGQHVILSLIHQLTMSDLSEKTDLKVKYIEDAITSLDSDNTLTKQHIGPVVSALEQRINMFMQKYPSHNLNRRFKRILLSSKSLLK